MISFLFSPFQVIPVRDAHIWGDLIQHHKLHLIEGADHYFRKPEYAQDMIAATVAFMKAGGA